MKKQEQKRQKTLSKAPEEMTKKELVEALRLSRASLWESNEKVRRLSAENERLKGQA